MTTADERLIQTALAREAAAWHARGQPSAYDHAVCDLFRELDRASVGSAHTAAVLALSEAALGRDDPTLVDSRMCSAERLLRLAATETDAAVIGRCRFLALLSWLQLGALVE